jgi:hypothetical protein
MLFWRGDNIVAISFSARKDFPNLIKQGIKNQTIRPFNAKRYAQIKRIKKLQLYWKQRTKECSKIADAELTEIFKIRFKNLIQIWNENRQEWIDADIEQIKEIIKRDGFEDGWQLYNAFYNMYGDKLHGMEFMVIRWRLKNEGK